MRYQGKITDWNDEKGFGFVTPNEAGPRVFIHIKSFSNRHRRPEGKSELVTYELTSDTRGRSQGVNVAFVGERQLSPRPATASGPGWIAFSFTFVFLIFVTGAVTIGKLPFPVLLVYLVSSCLAYLAYVFDKAAAVQGRWRTRENILHLFSLLGGWPGAMIAQKTLRHKTQKESFQLTYWATVVLNCAGVGMLLSLSGMTLVSSLFGGG